MNIRKFNDMKDIGHLCKHYERSVAAGHYSNESIDCSKLHLDTNLAPNRGKQTDYLKEKIEEIMAGRTLRKDAVKMCCWVVNLPKTVSLETENDFFNACYDFFIERYGKKSGMGEDVCLSSFIHRSEETPHMHFAFMPVIEKNGVKSFCAKDLLNRQELSSIHKDLGNYLETKGICKTSDILNGNTIRNSDGKAVSVFELKRRDYKREQERSRWDSNKEVEVKREDNGRW